MGKLLIAFAITIAFFCCNTIQAQDFSNKGRDFWIAYTGHIDATASVMGLYLTSDQGASGSVQVGGTTLPFTITAGKVSTLFIGPGGSASNATVYNGQADGINVGGGIHVVADRDIVVYAHIIRSARSGATLVLPKSVLGKEYIVPSYKNFGSSPSYGEIAVVAVEPATTIEITPTIPDRNGGHGAGFPFTVTLNNPGDVYQLQGQGSADFSGSIVRSISTGTGGCKPIAVFSSTTWSGFDCSGSSGGDNLYQQLFPTKSWGKKFVTAPFINKPYDIIRVFVQNPSTVVQKTESGVTSVLTAFYPAGNYYEIRTSQPTVIEADQPVSVVQYITSQSCGGGNSDPEMTLINPVEQTLDKITLFSAHRNYVPPGQTQVTSHYINVVIPTNKAATFLIDGGPPASPFKIIPNSGYSYLQENVTSSSAINPVHQLQADTGFTAIVYGYGDVESYGYNAGTNVRDLYQFVSVQNQYATVNFPSTCKNTPFRFSMTFPYQPTQIQWVFGAALNAQGIADVTVNSPAYDSTWVVNGKTLYRYPLPTLYTLPTVGTFPIKVIAQNPSPDGCNGQQEIDYDLQVFERPAADFSFSASGCITDSVHFLNIPSGSGRPAIRWFWNFDDAGSGLSNSSSLENPAHLFNIQGVHNVAFSLVTDIGCLSDTVRKPVTISQPPVANFSVAGPYCLNKNLTFTDASTISSGSLMKWTWNFGDGSAPVVATTNVSQTHAYATTGNFTVTLQVETAGGCKSLVFSKPVSVSATPVPNFTFSNGCLPSADIQFTNTSTISDGTESSFVYAWSFGDGSNTTAKDPLHTYTAAGPFDVQLVVVSNKGCTDSLKKSVNTIYAQPESKFTSPDEVCLGAPLSFTDQSTSANGTVSGWQWNFGDGQTSTQQSPAHTYAAPGNYTVTLNVASTVGCSSIPFTKNIAVNTLPIADFTLSSPQCAGQTVTLTDASLTTSGALVKWTWNFGDAAPAVISTTNASQTHLYTNTTNYTATLQVESNKGCVSTTASKQITINTLPVVGFKMPDNCLNDPVSIFTDTSSITDGTASQFSYLWNFGDPNASALNPNTATQKNGQHKFTAAQNYTISLTVTSNKGCSATATQVFSINGAVPLSAFSIRGGTQQCSNDSITITDNSTVDVGKLVKLEIYWDYGTNPTNKTTVAYPVKGKSYTHLYPEFFTPASTNVIVRVIAYSGDNCLHTFDQTINLKATPNIIFPPVTSICADQPSFQVSASASNLAGGTGSFSGQGISSSGIFNPGVAGFGTYPITYKYTALNGCINTKQQTITVFEVPRVNAGPDKFILGGGTAVLNGTGTGSRPAFLWTPATYLNNPAIAQPVATPANDILYKLTVTSADGCSSSDDVFVKVLKEPTIPNVFSPNGDGINDTWVIQYLESYPGATVEIFNRYGQKVFESKGYPKPWDGNYKGTGLPAGTYYYIINPKNGRAQMAGYVDIIR